MDLAEIKEFLANNQADPAVKTFVDSLADKRVSQARDKWQSEIEERVEKELEARAEVTRATEERKAALAAKIETAIQDSKIRPELAELFTPEDLGDVSDEEIESLVQGIITKASRAHDAIVKERFTAPPPTLGKTGVSAEDKFAESLRDSMGL
jgi:DNA-binding transcriptional MerR regulator